MHLITGVVAGVVIGIMSFTGVMLAFEKEIVAWAERGARNVTPAADAARLSVEEVLAKIREVRPDARSAPITFHADPNLAVLVSQGRTNAFYVNPYTDDYNAGFKVRRWTRFLHTGEALGPIGQAVAGSASLGGVFLVWTGLALAWGRFFGRRPVTDARP